jgi:polyisoprenoid-binding protein YceI
MTPGTTRPDIETGVWTLEKAHTTIGLVAKHLMVTKVRGRFESYEANVEVADDLTDSRIEVTIDAASITTGAEDRDNHLRSADFLDADNHPKLTFVSTGISSDGDKWKVTGDLTIRDMTRPVTLDVTYEGTVTDPGGSTRVGFSARAVLVREDWDLTWNAAIEGGGWLVSKDVGLEIEGQLIRA